MASETPLTFFAGVSSSEDDLGIEHLQVDANLQGELTALFRQQADEFIKDDTQIIEFNPKAPYRLERDQVFVIRKFELPGNYIDAVASPQQVAALSFPASGPLPSVSTIFAAETTYRKPKRLLFQNFRSSQLLDRRFTIFWTSDVFSKIENNGLSIAHELAAVWEDKNLYFRSFAIVSRFFQLADFEPKASPSEIRSFIDNSVFSFSDDDEREGIYTIIETDDFLRRRVASIQSKNILNIVRPVAVSNKAKAFGVNIPICRVDKQNKIALPSHKKELKLLVKFLNEEYFHGELSLQPYETNSLRPLKPT